MVRVAAAHDQPFAARLLRSALAEQEAELVGIVGSAAEAIHLVRELEPDVLLLDLALPGAFDVLDALSESASVQVVALASREAADARRRAAALGVDAFIRAEAGPAEVAQALQLFGLLHAAVADEPKRAPPPSPG
jgi:DNA-binding NarL/FixJ family response regulator